MALLRLAIMILLLGCTSVTYAQSQRVRVAVESAAPGQYQAHVYYQPSNGQKTTGLGIRVHFQQGVIRVIETTDVLPNSTGLQIQEDQEDHDKEVRTDAFLNAAWFDLGGNWPTSVSGEVLLFKLAFELQNPAAPSAVVFNISRVSTASGYELQAGNYQALLGTTGTQVGTGGDSVIRANAVMFDASVNADSDAELRNLLSRNPAALRFALDASPELDATWSADLTGALNDALGAGAQLNHDVSTGVLEILLPGERYHAMVSAVRLVSELLPAGLQFLPDGSIVLIHDGRAFEIAPVPANLPEFGALVSNAGYQLSLRDDGAMELFLGDAYFVGVSAYDSTFGAVGSCGAMEVVPPVGLPDSPAYAFTLRCANGAEQRIVPHTQHEGLYDLPGLETVVVLTDRNSGILTVAGAGRFKPDFFVRPLSALDSEYFLANTNDDGLALRAADVNADGRLDILLYTHRGVQAFFALGE